MESGQVFDRTKKKWSALRGVPTQSGTTWQSDIAWKAVQLIERIATSSRSKRDSSQFNSLDFWVFESTGRLTQVRLQGLAA